MGFKSLCELMGEPVFFFASLQIKGSQYDGEGMSALNSPTIKTVPVTARSIPV
jgi:hypothetical protein